MRGRSRKVISFFKKKENNIWGSPKINFHYWISAFELCHFHSGKNPYYIPVSPFLSSKTTLQSTLWLSELLNPATEAFNMTTPECRISRGCMNGPFKQSKKLRLCNLFHYISMTWNIYSISLKHQEAPNLCKILLNRRKCNWQMKLNNICCL